MSQFVQITSAKNPIVRRFRDAAAGEVAGVMVADGVKLVREALDAGRVLREVVTAPRLVTSAQGRELRRRLLSAGIASADCSDAVLARISSLTTHQGVAAIVERPRWQPRDLTGERALLVVAAGVRDPGNLGALLRTAEAAGASGLVALAGGADPFRDKAVRASSGSAFRLPVLGPVAADAVVELLRQSEAQVVVADAGGGRDYDGVDLRGPTALVVGSEAAGVPPALGDVAAVRVRIPMRPPVESLNVAVAAAVLLFEARRQRQAGGPR